MAVASAAPGWTPGHTADLLLKQEPIRCPVPRGVGGSQIGLHMKFPGNLKDTGTTSARCSPLKTLKGLVGAEPLGGRCFGSCQVILTGSQSRGPSKMEWLC